MWSDITHSCECVVFKAELDLSDYSGTYDLTNKAFLSRELFPAGGGRRRQRFEEWRGFDLKVQKVMWEGIQGILKNWERALAKSCQGNRVLTAISTRNWPCQQLEWVWKRCLLGTWLITRSQPCDSLRENSVSHCANLQNAELINGCWFKLVSL